MNYAEIAKKNIADKNAEVIAKFESRKEEIFKIILKGIERLGYVKIDTLAGHGATLEGQQLGVKNGELDAFNEFVKKEGFKTQKSWWGYSTDGEADMLKIFV